jgi:hypothetical protein
MSEVPMVEPEPSPNVAPRGSLFLTLFLFFTFGATAILSARWGAFRYGGLTVAGFNVFAFLTVVLFIFLVRKGLGATPNPEVVFTVSPSNIGPWTVLFAIEILVTFTALQVSSPSAGEGFILLGVLGFATGVLLGPSRMRPRERGVLAFAIGYIATFAGSILSIPFVYMEFRPSSSWPELIPVVAFAGILGVFEGGVCALGSLLGGSLRSRRAAEVATA